MMHFTCDQCGRELRPDGDACYEIKIQVRARHDPTRLTEEDLEDDHVEAMGHLLSSLEAGEETLTLTPLKSEFQFDLCAECHERFLVDPLGKDAGAKLSFSDN